MEGIGLKDTWNPEGPISKKIKERIKKAGKRFHSNDNISEFIKDGEIELLQAEVQEKLQGVLDSLVIDTENDHNTQETAKRISEKHSEADSNPHQELQVFQTWVTRVCTLVVQYQSDQHVPTTFRTLWVRHG
jgi:hypothetical protein